MPLGSHLLRFIVILTIAIVTTVPAPRIQAVVDDEARQMRKRRIGGGDRGAVGGGPRQQFAALSGRGPARHIG